MPRILAVLCVLLVAACAPREYHRQAERAVPAQLDASACVAAELRRLGYEIRDRDPDSGRLYAARARAQQPGARFPRADWLDVEVVGEGAARMLRVSVATLEGGGGGVSPRFRAPSVQAEADRDAILDACAGAASGT